MGQREYLNTRSPRVLIFFQSEESGHSVVKEIKKKYKAMRRFTTKCKECWHQARQSGSLIWMCDFPGGLFHPSDDKQEVAFRYAVEKINANRDILPKSRLSAQIEQIKPQDSFHASKRGECFFFTFVNFAIKQAVSVHFCHDLSGILFIRKSKENVFLEC